MMRKRSIMSVLLAFCLCFSMITPAMAAEVNAEAQIEAQAMSRLADFDFVQSADVNEATFSLDGESVLIQNLSETATLDEISKAELADVIESVAYIRETEMDEKTDLINYFYLIGNKIYLYEGAANHIDGVENKLVIIDVNDSNLLDSTKELLINTDEYDLDENNNEISLLKTSNVIGVQNRTTKLDDGVGARLEITNSSINYMEATLCDTNLDVFQGINNSTVFNYIYLGFHCKGLESDLGLQVSRATGNICGYNPYWMLDINGTPNGIHTTDVINVGNTSKLYYLPTDDIVLSVYKNNGNNHPSASVYGKAVYRPVNATKDSIGFVKTIMVNNNFYTSQIPSIQFWKIVNTISPALKNGTPLPVPGGCESYSKFKNIKVNGNPTKLSTCYARIYNYGLPEDYGNVESTSDNNIDLNELIFFLKSR